MKKLNFPIWFSYFLIPALFMLVVTKVGAQTPMFFKGGGSSTNTIPMNTSGSHAQHIYEPSDFNAPPTPGLISKIYLKNAVAGGTGTYTNFSVAFLQNNLTAFPNTTFLTGFTTALSTASITINGNAAAGGWYEIPLTTPFLYDPGQSLIVEIKYTSKTGGMSTVTTTAPGNKRLSITSAPGAATGNLSTLWGDFGMDLLPAAPCASPIAGGTSTASATSACAGTLVNFNLSGNSIGGGLTYEWESSPNNTVYTSLAPAQAGAYFPHTVTTTAWYRCKLICSGGTPVYSTPIQVTVLAPLNGVYTINNANPTGGTNFASFTAAIDALNCGGVAGPVTFNVSPGTPYVETLNFGTINGVSTSQPVRFNGNGATVQFTNTTSARQLLTFDGTNHVRIDSLIFKSLDATFGWGARIAGGASYDSLTRCQFDLSSVTSTTAANVNGILFTASATAIATAGVNGKHIYIANNHIKGSAAAGGLNYGIGIAAGGSDSNIIKNNVIENFYNNGVYIASAKYTIVEGNEIHKANKTAGIVAGEGIYTASGDMSGSKIIGNRIHSPGGTAGATTVFRGLSLLGDGTATEPILVANNVIYNINQGGASSGIYISTGLYNLVYHNTITFDQVLGGTAVNYGIYSTGANTGTEITNNMVSITAGTGGIKYGFYHATANGISDAQKNNYYLNSTQAGVQNYGYYTTAYATQAAFQTAYPALEIGSPTANPQFTAPATGNFLPGNITLLNAGSNLVSLVPSDINNQPRSATPTIGAFESLPTGINDAATVALISPLGNICAAPASIKVSVMNAGTNNINSLQVNWRLNGTLQTPLTYNSPLVPVGAPSGQNMDTITLGTATLNAGNNTIQVWTSLPNGVNDLNTANDTLNTSINTVQFVVTPAADTICGNSTSLLSLSPASGYSANSTISWEWSTNGTTWNTVTGANNNSYEVDGITTSRQYRAKIDNDNLICYSNLSTITLDNIAVLSSTGNERCGPGTLALSATPSSGVVNWYAVATGGTALHTGNSFTTPNINATTTYYAEAATGSGGIVNVGPLSPSTLGAGGYTSLYTYKTFFTVLAGTTLTSVDIFPQTVGSTGSIQILSEPSLAVVSTTPFTVTTAGSLVNGQTVTLNAPLPPGNYSIKFATGTTGNYYRNTAGASFPYTSPVANVTGHSFNGYPQYYYYTYNFIFGAQGCASPRVPVVATIHEVPAVDLGNDTLICPQTSLTLDGTSGSGTVSYLWSTGATTPSINVSAAGTYSLSVANSNCSGQDTIVIGNAPVPVATMPDSAAICDGQMLSLNAGNNGATYLWSDGSNNQTLDVHTGGLYTVNITNTNACSVIDSTFVTVNAVPQVELGNDTIICRGEALVLDAANSGSGFLWNNGAQTQSVTVSQEGTYSVIVTNAQQCSATDTIEVSTYDAASVNGFHFTPRFDLEAGRVDFMPIDPMFVNSYHWDFGDGNTSTLSSPSNVYANSGNYLVTLTVVNDCGPKDTSLLINVDLFTGVKEAGAAALNIDVFPVPATDHIRIESRDAGLLLQSATVVNTIGQIIPLTYNKNNQHIYLDLKPLAAGNYIIVIETSKGKAYRRFNILK